jgi:hypothetical protein
VSSATRSSKIRSTSILATITGVFICFGLLATVLSMILGDDFLPEPKQGEPLSYFFGFAGMIVAISVIWFWLQMLIDYFRNRPDTRPVAWGFALVLLTYIAALAYFWLVWRPRNTKAQASNA